MSAPRVEPALSALGAVSWRRLAAALGPGVVVMLADTDAGSVFTAAASGERFGYKLLLPQFLIIPALYAMQELTIRLGIGAGCGFGELILRRLGKGWARLAIAVLIVSCFGALATQLSALAGLGRLYGVPIPMTVGATVVFFAVVATMGRYASVERIAIALGLFELAFLLVAWKSTPDFSVMAADMRQAPLGEPSYLYLLAANLGASVMPWAPFYQQSASVDKKLTREHFRAARLETLGGAILCQAITAAVLIAAAAAHAGHPAGENYETIAGLSAAFARTLGGDFGRLVFVVGLSGAALVATIVVSLAVAWSLGEVAGYGRSLDHGIAEAPRFYAGFIAFLVAGGLFVATGVDPTRLSIAVGVVNAVLVPVILALLYRLARSELGDDLKLRGAGAAAVGALFAAVSAVSLFAGLVGAFG